MLAEDERGQEILRLQREKAHLCEAIWLATAPPPLQRLWRQARALLGEEPTALEQAALAATEQVGLRTSNEAEQRRYDAGLSTTFLVTQAQRDLLQAQVNLLQTTLDYQSSLVNFEAVQQAPPLTAGDTVGVRGANVVFLPTPAPRGLFRQGAGSGFEN